TARSTPPATRASRRAGTCGPCGRTRSVTSWGRARSRWTDGRDAARRHPTPALLGFWAGGGGGPRPGLRRRQDEPPGPVTGGIYLQGPPGWGEAAGREGVVYFDVFRGGAAAPLSSLDSRWPGGWTSPSIPTRSNGRQVPPPSASKPELG